jgi:hypothetical protein
MRLKLIISFLLLCFGLQAQNIIDGKYYNRSKTSNIWDGVGGDSVLYAPKVKATNGKNEGSIMYNRNLKSLEVYDSATRRWYPILSFKLSDGVIEGGNVSWTGTGLEFYVSESVYVIGGILYFGNDTTVTLAASDLSDPRLDVIGLDAAGVITITGTPAADPAKPQVTPGEELELTSILVAAGATTPTGVTQEVIYDENIEWTVATNNITADPDNALFTFRGDKSIDIDAYPASSGRTISFTNSTVVDLSQFSLLTLYVRLNADYPADATVNVQFTRVSGFFTLSYSSVVTITNGFYNYVRTNDAAYQVIQIPLSAFTYSSSLFAPSEMNRLTLTFNGAASGMYVDYINLQGGVSIPSSGVTTFNNRSGNIIPIKDDYDQWFIDTTYRRADSVFAKKNGVELFQYKDSTGSGSTYYDGDGIRIANDSINAGGSYSKDSISFISSNQKPFAATVKNSTGSLQYSQIALNHLDATIKWQSTASWYGQLSIGNTYANLYYINGSNYAEALVSTTQARLNAGAGSNSTALSVYSDRTEFQGNFSVPKVTFYPDSIYFNLGAGRFNINNFESAVVDTVNWKPVVYNPSTKRMVRLHGWPSLGGVPYTLINGGNNLGSGSQVFKDTSSNKINLRSIVQGWNTKVTQNTNDITISVDTTIQTITDGATVTFDANAGVSAKVTLGGNRTLAFSNFRNGMFLSLLVIQDGTGGRTLTLPASTRVINGGAGAVTLTTAASSHDILTFWKINDVIYCNYGKNYN